MWRTGSAGEDGVTQGYERLRHSTISALRDKFVRSELQKSITRIIIPLKLLYLR